MAQLEIEEGPEDDIEGVFFGVPSSVSLELIEEAAENLYSILDNQPADFAIGVLPAAGGRRVHWFTFVGSPRDYELGAWIESLTTDLPAPLDIVVHHGAGGLIHANQFERGADGKDAEVDRTYLDVLAAGQFRWMVHGGEPDSSPVAKKDLRKLGTMVEPVLPSNWW